MGTKALDEVKNNNSQLLADLLSGVKSKRNKQQFRQHFDELNEDQEVQFVDEILHDAIAKAQRCQAPIPILNFLYETYQGENKQSLIMMIRLQVQIFKVFVIGGQNWEIRPRCGYVLFKIKANKDYELLEAGWKQKVDLIVTQLPRSVQYVFFLPMFCLMNDYYSEYLYSSERSMDEDNRYVWTWLKTKLEIDDMGHIRARIYDSVDEDSTDFSVQLVSTRFGTVYYTMLSTKRVAGWELSNDPINSYWKINFIDDELVTIGQGSNFLCADSKMHDVVRRYVCVTECCKPSKPHYWKLGRSNRK